MNTIASEVVPTVTPSMGRGSASASVEAISRPATPASVEPLGRAATSATTTATMAAAPMAATGSTTGRVCFVSAARKSPRHAGRCGRLGNRLPYGPLSMRCLALIAAPGGRIRGYPVCHGKTGFTGELPGDHQATRLAKIQRIHRAAKAAHLEMEVRARAPTRAARSADSLSGPDRLADAHAPAGEVRVEARETPAACDLDDVAVALESTRLTDRDDRAGLSRADRERAEDPDVDPGVTRAERGRDRSACRPG